MIQLMRESIKQRAVALADNWADNFADDFIS